mgnify:CR=1 FL=1
MAELARTVSQMLSLASQMRHDGATPAEVTHYLEGVLRQAWPAARVWHYLCATCDDYGLEMWQCPGDVTCGRRFPHMAHSFGKPCTCAKGRPFRPPRDDDPLDAANSRKRRGGRL